MPITVVGNMAGFVFTIIGPVVGTILFGLDAYGLAILWFIPIGMIIGFIPAVVSALTFHFILKRSTIGHRYRILLTITATVIAGVISSLFVWTVLLYGPYDVVLIRVCITAAATAFICAYICLTVPAIKVKYIRS